ncbi:MAG: hypothetical protein LBH52_04765 [Puniceicoccales bacterium]|jgi:hypothetical protein|nr:hypothetical protein [Puniceicoccales bacterium]
MTVTTLGYVVGILLVFFGVFFNLNASQLSINLCRLLRNNFFGISIFVLGVLWFLWHVGHLSEADFGQYKHWLIFLFVCVFGACCVYWQDWLAVRGIALLAILTMHPCLSVGYMQLHPVRPWLSLLFYIVIVTALFFGVYPYRVRDFVAWSCKQLFAWPIRLMGLASFAYGIFILHYLR